MRRRGLRSFLSLSQVVRNNLSPEAQDTDIPNPWILWSELKRSYGTTTSAQLAELMARIWKADLGEGEDPVPHIARLRSAYSEIVSTGEVFSDKWFAIAIIKSLPRSYDVTAQTLYQQSNLNSADVFTAVQTEWNHRSSNDDSTS